MRFSVAAYVLALSALAVGLAWRLEPAKVDLTAGDEPYVSVLPPVTKRFEFVSAPCISSFPDNVSSTSGSFVVTSSTSSSIAHCTTWIERR